MLSVAQSNAGAPRPTTRRALKSKDFFPFKYMADEINISPSCLTTFLKSWSLHSAGDSLRGQRNV